MAALEDERRERFARNLADDMPAWRAWAAAGYAPKGGRGRIVAQREDVKARVDELVQARKWGGSSDLGPVIDECMRLTQVAGKMKTAAAMVAARGLLVEAARLKGLLGAPAPRAGAPEPRPELTDDEWLARYAPPANGA